MHPRRLCWKSFTQQCWLPTPLVIVKPNANFHHLRHLSQMSFLSYFPSNKTNNQNTTSTNTFQPNLCKSLREPTLRENSPFPLPSKPSSPLLSSPQAEPLKSFAVNEKVTYVYEPQRWTRTHTHTHEQPEWTRATLRLEQYSHVSRLWRTKRSMNHLREGSFIGGGKS